MFGSYTCMLPRNYMNKRYHLSPCTHLFASRQGSINGIEMAVISTWSTMTINPKPAASFKPAAMKMVS